MARNNQAHTATQNTWVSHPNQGPHGLTQLAHTATQNTKHLGITPQLRPTWPQTSQSQTIRPSGQNCENHKQKDTRPSGHEHGYHPGVTVTQGETANLVQESHSIRFIYRIFTSKYLYERHTVFDLGTYVSNNIYLCGTSEIDYNEVCPASDCNKQVVRVL